MRKLLLPGLAIASLLIACGYQPSGSYRGRHVDVEDVFVGAMHAQVGQLAVEDLDDAGEATILAPAAAHAVVALVSEQGFLVLAIHV